MATRGTVWPLFSPSGYQSFFVRFSSRFVTPFYSCTPSLNNKNVRTFKVFHRRLRKVENKSKNADDFPTSTQQSVRHVGEEVLHFDKGDFDEVQTSTRLLECGAHSACSIRLKVRAARARKNASLAPSAFLTVTYHVVKTKILEKSFMFIKRPVYLTGRLSPPPTRSPSLITPFLSYFCTIPERFWTISISSDFDFEPFDAKEPP